MEISILEQLIVAIKSSFIGCLLGGIYDIVRILRAFWGIKYVNKFTNGLSTVKLPLIKNPFLCFKEKNDKKERILLFVTDIFFFLMATLVMIIFVYYANDGIPRLYIYAGVIIGFFAYYFTVGKMVIAFSEIVVFGIKICFAYVGFFLSRPFIYLINLLKKRIKKAKENIKKSKDKKAIKLNEKEDKKTEIMRIGRC